jgi:DNA primase
MIIRWALNRLLIPITMNDQMVGWQARYVGDLNWKEARTLKYYSCPNMPRRLMLYNYDNAKALPYVVITEGPSDVWNIGINAVAAFGKNLSADQIKLVCGTWEGGAIVILLDGDAWEDTEKLVKKFQAAGYSSPIIPIKLPEEHDPGSLDRDLLNNLIVNAGNACGIDLLNIQRTKQHDWNPSKSISLGYSSGIGQCSRLATD